MNQAALLNLRGDRHIEDEGPHGPEMTDPSEPFRGVANYMWFAAATKRYGSSGMGPGYGENRAQIDSCGLFTFYDPKLSAQSDARITEERLKYNLTEIGQ